MQRLTPLASDEVKPGLKISDFTIYIAVEEIKQIDELFMRLYLEKGIDIKAVIKKMERL